MTAAMRTQRKTLHEHFVLETGTAQTSVLAERIARDIARYVGFSEKDTLHFTMALYEALTNAVDHGNLRLSSDLISDDPMQIADPFEAYTRLRDERMASADYAHKRVWIEYVCGDDGVTVTVEDEGEGFDRCDLPDPNAPENLTKVHGRGLMLIHSLMDSVRFNEKGNAITFTKRPSVG